MSDGFTLTLIDSVVKTCAYCQQEFTIHKKNYTFSSQKSGVWKSRKTCNNRCAYNLALTRRDDIGNPWSEDELELLFSWLNKKPINLIAREWNCLAAKKGWQPRSKNAIKVKATRMMGAVGGSIKSVEDNWDSRTLARLLGTQLDKVRSWRRRGIIKYTKLSRSQTAISRKQLKKFATLYPQELGGIDPKKLRKVLKDGKLVKAITQVANNAPRIGRPITIIRLDTGDVYPSARQAAVAVAPEMGVNDRTCRANILRVAKKETSLKNGMDFYQLDYPVYWVPLDIREEFNLTAGKMLYEIYLELVELDGYNKMSCLVVAARLAVQITLWYFRRVEKDRLAGEKLPVKETYLLFWQTKLLERIKTFIGFDTRTSFNKIINTIVRKTWYLFSAVSSSREKTRMHAEEFALELIASQQRFFYKHSFLPKNYEPKTQLEKADLFVFIFGTLLNYIQIGSKEKGNVRQVGFVFLKAMNYVDKHHLRKNTNYDDAIKIIDDNSDINKAYAQAIETIKSKVKASEFEQIELYIALKLEEATDAEIADCMGIEEYKVRAIAEKIKQILLRTSHGSEETSEPVSSPTATI